jgi:hypothetical protein
MKKSHADSEMIWALSHLCEVQDFRCEYLNQKIAEALGWEKHEDLWYSPKELEAVRKKKKSICRYGYSVEFLPRLTSSIDDAMELALEFGFVLALGDLVADGLPGCVLCVSTNPLVTYTGTSLAGKDSTGRLARAVTAACLAAKASQLEIAEFEASLG